MCSSNGPHRVRRWLIIEKNAAATVDLQVDEAGRKHRRGRHNFGWGLMVSMRASNAKLLRRAEVILSQIVGCDENDAAKFVQRAEGDVKIAVLLGLGWEQTEAIEALLKHEGNLRSAIDELAHDPT
jgi:hypothetical protein